MNGFFENGEFVLTLVIWVAAVLCIAMWAERFRRRLKREENEELRRWVNRPKP